MTPLALTLLLAVAAPVRVYVPPVNAANTDAATSSLVTDRILVEARRHSALFDVVSNDAIKGVLDAEAQRQALSCDADSCQAEIADALAAPQLVTGQLGHIGETWQLTLTRIDRETLQVIARASRQAQGSTPENLLPAIPGLVDEVFGVTRPGPSPMAVAGMVTAGVGGAAFLGGVGLWGLSWFIYDEATRAVAKGDRTAALEAQAKGEGLVVPSYVLGGAGLVIGGAGALLLMLAPAGE